MRDLLGLLLLLGLAFVGALLSATIRMDSSTTFTRPDVSVPFIEEETGEPKRGGNGWQEIRDRNARLLAMNQAEADELTEAWKTVGEIKNLSTRTDAAQSIVWAKVKHRPDAEAAASTFLAELSSAIDDSGLDHLSKSAAFAELASAQRKNRKGSDSETLKKAKEELSKAEQPLWDKVSHNEIVLALVWLITNFGLGTAIVWVAMWLYKKSRRSKEGQQTPGQ